ncbi:MAG: hypothetical protein IJQ94_05000 [Bacteroidales bacterium]|nr:hypothetical protein [Bacteroidales bacterium]
MNTYKFFQLSESCRLIKDVFLCSAEMKALYSKLTEAEQKSLINHYIIDNPPYAFMSIPLLFDQVKQFIGKELEVSVDCIKLIGSAKQGFSIDPQQYGKSFSEKSDMDFTIIDVTLFEKLKRDFETWQLAYNSKKVFPRNNTEEFYWNENIKRLPDNIKRGFVDHHKIPLISSVCPTNNRINNVLYCVRANLPLFNINTKGLSLRVYKDYTSFYKQIKLNTDYCMSKIPK